MTMLTMDDLLEIVKPHNGKIIAEARAAALLAALKEIRDQTIAVQHSQETRLNDIFDIATAAIKRDGA